MQLRLALGGLFAARYRTGSGSQCIIMRLVAHCHLLTNKKTAALFDFDKLGFDTGKSAIQNKQGARILQVEKASTYVGAFFCLEFMQLRLALSGLFAARYRTGSGSQCISSKSKVYSHLPTNKKTAALFAFDKPGSEAGKSAKQDKQGARILQVEKPQRKLGLFFVCDL